MINKQLVLHQIKRLQNKIFRTQCMRHRMIDLT
jgi:hypothetical protein